MDSTDFLNVAREFARGLFPDRDLDSVTIRTKTNDVLTLSMEETPDDKLATMETLKESEMKVLGCIPDHDKQAATSEKILHALGNKSKSHLLKILRRLRKQGFVVLDADGYRKRKL